MAAVFLSDGCVDDKIEGVATQLLATSPPSGPLAPGATADLAFQAVDDSRQGVPDQAIETVITDLSRLNFVGSPGTNRVLVTTDRQDTVDGVILSGVGIVHLVVPETAPPGAATVVASLEGKKGASPKTQWVTLEVGQGGASGAAGGGSGANSGGGGGGGIDAGTVGGSPESGAGAGG